jgi:stage V sporulation protein SpoVS
MNPLGLVVDAAVRGSALFVIAGILACVLRKRSAASRHLVWTAAINGAIGVIALLVSPGAWTHGMVRACSFAAVVRSPLES